MIASLRGALIEKGQDRLILDVNGVGYEVLCPATALETLPDKGAELFLHIYTAVREDAITLYGFVSSEQKKLFLLLLGVSGIGPKLAMAMVANSQPAAIARAIATEDIAVLVALPGIGKKTAERLCLELKDKVDWVPLAQEEQPAASVVEDSRVQDAISALTNLGYQPAAARQAVETLASEMAEVDFAGLSLEELLRLALRSLA